MNQNRRVFLLIVTLFVAASAAFAQQKKMAAPAKEYTIEQFMNTVRIGGSSFSSDEKSILFHNNKSGIFNVYSVPVSGGAPTQLTNSTKESTFAVSYFPTDSRFLYTYDRGGNEKDVIVNFAKELGLFEDEVFFTKLRGVSSVEKFRRLQN